MKHIARTIFTCILIALAIPLVLFAQGNFTGGTGGALNTGGLTVTFPPQLQIIGQNTAELHGQVSVALAMPVELSALFGIKGSPLGNEMLLLSVPATITPPSPGLQPGTVTPVTINLTGLTIGQTYQFTIKNKITNQIGTPPLEFTTTGGANPGGVVTYSGGLFPYTPSANAGTGSATETPVFTDTVSEKGIVPNCGRPQNAEGTVPADELAMCDFDDFMELVANVIQYGLVLLGLFVAIIAIYSGAQIIMLGKVADKTSEQTEAFRNAKARGFKVMIGLVIIFMAWVGVSTIYTELGVKPQYSFLDIVS